MNYKVIVLAGAKQDLQDIQYYLIKNFSKKEWNNAYQKIKKSLLQLQTFPLSGVLFEEIKQLDLYQYRQIIVGMNRIVYQIKEKKIYIHFICDVRRDMKALFSRRLFH